MAQTTARPTTVVVDYIPRLRNFTCQKARVCEEKLRRIRAVGAPFGGERTPDTETISQFYDFNDFMNPTALLNRHPKAKRTNMANVVTAMMAKEKGTATTSEKVKSISSKWRAAAKQTEVLHNPPGPSWDEEEAGAEGEAGSSD